MKKKICTKCKRSRSIDDFTPDYTRPEGVRSHCKSCVSDYNHNTRQRRLEKEFNKPDGNVKRCPCGNYFKFKISNGSGKVRTLTRCRECAEEQPQVKVYVPELKKSVWVKIPRKYHVE